MSLDIAYSIELEDYIDPDKAYDLFWAGIIKNKQGFICPGTKCYAKITCANIDKDHQNMKVVPHFRIYGSHYKDCEISNRIPLRIETKLSSGSVLSKKPIIESTVDNFLLKRPESYYETGKSSNKYIDKKINRVYKKKDFNLSEIDSISNIYSVRSMVSRFIRYKKSRLINLKKVNIEGKEMKYEDIFESIWYQDIEKLPNYPQIYHGWAYVNRLPSGKGYQIKFKKKLLFDLEEYVTTAIIPDWLINKYKVKKLVSCRLTKIYNQEKAVGYVFLYGIPKINKSGVGKKYANIRIDNLDLVDINYSDPFSENL